MKKQAKTIALTVAVLCLILFIVFLVNQTVQLVDFGDRISPILGSVILWGLLILYSLCLAVPIYLVVRMPSALKPPQDETSPEFPEYLKGVAKRLGKNPLIKRSVAASKEDLEYTFQILDRHADDIIKKTANRIFITTAISQNGKLDALIVLFAQSKLIYEIARTYYQRPKIRNLIHLYANVALVVFLASEIEDMDLSELIQPILTGILGSAAGTIPGFQIASILLVSSVISGTSNAFLTLRVGAITKRYCRSLVAPSRQSVRHYASLEAAKMLGAIVTEGTKKISALIWSSSKNKMGEAVGGMGTYIKETGETIARKLRFKNSGQKVPVKRQSRQTTFKG